MIRNFPIYLSFLFLLSAFACNGPVSRTAGLDALRAGGLLDSVLTHYGTSEPGLFREYYPDGGVPATYLSGGDTLADGRMAYLWPASGVWSAANALWKATGDTACRTLVENVLLPGIAAYLDTVRTPHAYQSYLAEAGLSDRFYDDNVWLGLDFLETYSLTSNPCYLGWAFTVWDFLMSGCDPADGAVYWCEQRRETKNACSNAPAAVFALRLYGVTGDSAFLAAGRRLYGFTKRMLRDTADGLYFDKVFPDGTVDRRKYAYNSGQMMQAAVLLYETTGDSVYINDARQIAAAALPHFTEPLIAGDDTLSIFRGHDVWFTAVLLRGYAELFRLTGDARYIDVFARALDYAWYHARYDSGLMNADFSGKRDERQQWLLTQAGYAEMYAVLAQIEKIHNQK